MGYDENTQVSAFKDYKVKRPRLEEMDRALWRAISGHRGYILLALYGASEVGKAPVMKQVAEHYREVEADLSCAPTVVVQASPEDIGALARLDYDLAQLQWHVAVKGGTTPKIWRDAPQTNGSAGLAQGLHESHQCPVCYL